MFVSNITEERRPSKRFKREFSEELNTSDGFENQMKDVEKWRKRVLKTRDDFESSREKAAKIKQTHTAAFKGLKNDLDRLVIVITLKPRVECYESL